MITELDTAIANNETNTEEHEALSQIMDAQPLPTPIVVTQPQQPPRNSIMIFRDMVQNVHHKAEISEQKIQHAQDRIAEFSRTVATPAAVATAIAPALAIPVIAKTTAVATGVYGTLGIARCIAHKTQTICNGIDQVGGIAEQAVRDLPEDYSVVQSIRTGRFDLARGIYRAATGGGGSN